jgi:hypothetical protein
MTPWQQQMRDEQRCTHCGEPSGGKWRCDTCTKKRKPKRGQLALFKLRDLDPPRPVYYVPRSERDATLHELGQDRDPDAEWLFSPVAQAAVNLCGALSEEECARILGISKTRVQQIHEAAKVKLRDRTRLMRLVWRTLSELRRAVWANEPQKELRALYRACAEAVDAIEAYDQLADMAAQPSEEHWSGWDEAGLNGFEWDEETET